MNHGQRSQEAQADRKEYFKNLAKQSTIVEQKGGAEESEIDETINELEERGAKLNEEFENHCKLNGLDHDTSLFFPDEETLVQELSKLKEKSNNLKRFEREIDALCHRIRNENFDDIDDRNELLRRLDIRIEQLEIENSSLQGQIRSHDCPLPISSKNLDYDLLKYLEEHDKELTLNYLKEAYKTILDIKASKSNINFSQYRKEIKEQQSSYISKLTKLQVEKRKMEIQLEERRLRYCKEMKSFSKRRLEHILKNCGAKEKLDSLQEINALHQGHIDLLKKRMSLMSP